MIKRILPKTGELLPVIGMGTWKSCDVIGENEKENLKHLLIQMHESGSSLIDTSPMYGRAENVIGEVSKATGWPHHFFYATKVWTSGKEEGIAQMKSSIQKMKCIKPDLIQIHNLVDWKTQLQTLLQWKAEGKVRYIGITHYTDSMHDVLADIISTNPIDFVQFNYSIFSRNAEKKLFSVARDNGVATIINRPLEEGLAIKRLQQKKLPDWSADYNITSWPMLILKFIISHPDVTCVIPATSKSKHLMDNLLAGSGLLPEPNERLNWLKSLQ